MKILRKAGTVLLAAVMCLSSFFAENIHAQEPDKEPVFEYLTAFTSSDTFTPPRNGLYKIYCVGKSGDGGSSNNGYQGNGGGGSGGISVSMLRLEKNKSYPYIVSTSKTSWDNDSLYATAGVTPTGLSGGAGGQAYGGNFGNSSGYSGGNGASEGRNTGTDGGNGGMKGGKQGGWDNTGGIHAYGGGGGGARLSDTYCPYVSPTYTTNYKAEGGTYSYTAKRNGKVSRFDNPAKDSTPYPALSSSPVMILFGGGGGAGGYTPGSRTLGTPGVIIIEQCTDTTPPVIDSVAFSKDRKRVTLTASDEYGIAGYYINGTFVEGNPLTYSIPTGTVQLTIQAEDNAGNRSPEQTVDVLPAAPGITVMPDKPWLNAADGKASVTLSTDAEGIFENVKLWYSLDGGAGWTPYTAPFDVTETCTVTAKVSCKNGDSDTAQKEIHIDLLAPSISSAIVDETDMEHRFLTVTAQDTGGSGVKCIWIDDKPYTDNPCTYPIPDVQETVMLKVEDVAGNLSKPKKQVVRHIDTIPPTIDTVEFTKDLSVVTIRMSDDTYGDGVKGVYINGEFKTGNPILWAVPEDVSILRLQAEDQAGNKSEIRREHVPGRMAILDTITIESVAFSEDNTTATVTAATSEPGTTIRGIYCNEELVEGNPVTYQIPIENSQYLKVQAVNNEGDRSELVTKRVPGWTEVTNKIAVTSVEFLKSNTRARVRADTTRKSRIMGIYVNKEFYDGNPIECPVTSVQLECQAVDEYGDLSQPVVRQVPAAPQSTSRSRGGKGSGGGTASTTRILISDPILQKDGQYRIDISAKDSECDIEKIVAVFDGQKEDITKTRFLLLDYDTLLQVIAVNDEGRMTYKKVRICLEKEPVVEELEEEAIPASANTKRTTKPNPHPGASAPAGGVSQSSDSNTQDDTKERLAQLLQQQRLKKYGNQPMPKMETKPEVSETIRRTSASNRPGVAAVAASVLCFLALMTMVALLVLRQQKASAYCKQVGTAKKV